MPEAVASNSTRAPENHMPREGLSSLNLHKTTSADIRNDLENPFDPDELEDIELLIRGWGEMVATYIEQQVSLNDPVAFSVHIQSRIFGDLVRDIRRAAERHVKVRKIGRQVPMDGTVDIELIVKVTEMARDAWTKAGLRAEDDEEFASEVFSWSMSYYSDIVNSIRYNPDLLEAGAQLPRIREAMTKDAVALAVKMQQGESDSDADKDDDYAAASPISVQRAETAKRLHNEGHSLAQISQIMNIKRSAVERIMARLDAAPDATE